MTDRIKYPKTWSQFHKDALDALFAEARSKGLWFFISSMMIEPMWFSPDELQAEQAAGRFIWSAENWRLRDPNEGLKGLGARAAAAVSELKAFQDRIDKSRV